MRRRTVAGLVGVLLGAIVMGGVISTQIYPQSGIVENVNYDDNTVHVVDFSQNEWIFRGTEDWQEGDICSMIMFKNWTSEIYNDIILKAEYDGYIY